VGAGGPKRRSPLIPKYRFQVKVTRKVGERLFSETHHYETLIAAATSPRVSHRKAGVKRIEVVMVTDEMTLHCSPMIEAELIGGK
jgi:tRNA U54 and U55 pseudouridine synthase Pus10